MRKVLLALCCCFVFGSALASPPTVDWALQIFGPSPAFAEMTAVSVSPAGVIYVVGRMSGREQLWPWSLYGGGQNTGFIAKVAANGTVTWVRRIGVVEGFGPSLEATGVAVDSSGDVYVTGVYTGTNDLGTTASRNLLTGLGGPSSSHIPIPYSNLTDVFVMKLSGLTGASIWGKRQGSVGADSSVGIGVDGSSRVTIAGRFLGTMTFSDGSTLNATSSNVENVWVAQYTGSNGTLIWKHAYGGSTSPNQANGVSVDPSTGAVYVCGTIHGTSIAFGALSPVTTNGTGDAFLLKLDSSGVEQWVKNFTASANEAALTCSTNGTYVAVVGTFSGTWNGGGSTLTNAAPGDDVFVALYNAAGTHQWSKQWATPVSFGLYIGNVLVDAKDKTTVTAGYFSNQAIDLGDGAGSIVQPCSWECGPGNTNPDVLMVQYGSTGTIGYKIREGAVDSDYGLALAGVAGGDVLYACGSFQTVIVFGDYKLAPGFTGASTNTDRGWIAKFEN